MAFNVVGAGPQFIDTQTADADLKVGSCVKRSATGFAQAGANWRSLCLVLPDETVGGENSDTIQDGDACRAQYVAPGQTAYALVAAGSSAAAAGQELAVNASGILIKKPSNGHIVAQLDEAAAAGTTGVFRRIRGV